MPPLLATGKSPGLGRSAPSATGKSPLHYLNKSREMISRMISEVPEAMGQSR